MFYRNREYNFSLVEIIKDVPTSSPNAEIYEIIETIEEARKLEKWESFALGKYVDCGGRYCDDGGEVLNEKIETNL